MTQAIPVEQLSEERLRAIDLNQQALTLLNSGHVEQAIAYLHKAIDADKTFHKSYFNLSTCLISQDRYDEAEQQLNTAMLLEKTDGEIYFNLGNISFLRHDLDKGLDYYNRAISYGFDTPDVQYFLGMAYEEKGDLPLALRHVTKAIKGNPASPEFRVKKALLQVELGQLDEALETADEIIIANKELFDGYHVKCQILFMMGRFPEAEQVVAGALELFPDDMALYYDRVRCVAAQGRYDEALSMIETAEQNELFHIQAAEFLYLKAELYGATEQLDKATETAKACLALEPEDRKNMPLRFMLMNLSLAQKDFRQLFDYAVQIIEEDQRDEYFRSALYYRAFSSRQLKDPKEAEYYKEAISLFRLATIKEPGAADAYLFRAMALKDTGDLDQALEITNMIMTVDDSLSEPYVIRADIFKEMGEMAKSQDAIDKAIQRKPELREMYQAS